MSVDVTLLRALTAAANSLRFNPEIAPGNAEIYEQLLIELRDDLGRELTKNVTPPPNDPLTLEELREMDGEPVYMIDLTGGELWNQWIIFETSVDGGFIPRGGGWFSAEGYGQTWLAYRRKPEEALTSE